MNKIITNILKRLNDNVVNSNDTIVETISNDKQSDDMSNIIQEIHTSFYSEVDRLLEYANVKQEITFDTSKAKRLKSLGFTNAENVEEILYTESEILKENHNKEQLIQAIDYFSSKYPLYKFITEDSVRRICEKYNLIYGSVHNYIGDVPDKNLSHIENFKIDEEDCLYYKKDKSLFLRDYTSNECDYSYFKTASPYSHYVCTKAPFEIVAPEKDFNTKNIKIENHKLSKRVILDPVVLHPVFYNYKKYYLIVTAWGDEASDPEVINPNNN